MVLRSGPRRWPIAGVIRTNIFLSSLAFLPFMLLLSSAQIPMAQSAGEIEFQFVAAPTSTSSHTSTSSFPRTDNPSDRVNPCDEQTYGGCEISVCAREFRWPQSDGNSNNNPAMDYGDKDRCKYGHGSIIFAYRRNGTVGNWLRISRSLKLVFSSSWKGSFAFHVRIQQRRSSKTIFEKSETRYHLTAGAAWTSLPIVVQNVSSAEAFNFELRYKVHCRQNFFGANCDVRCEINDWERSIGHFECSASDGIKRCARDWQGQECNLPRKCDCVNGNCDGETGKCICDRGWWGENCQQCKKYERCQGHCVKPYDCICQPGRGGKNCDIDLTYCATHKPCKNQGLCQNHENGSYTCNCRAGFTGVNCQTKMSSCEQEPCRNGARCIQSPHSHLGFRCECPPGGEVFGRFCQVRIRPRSGCSDRPCENGGSCLPLDTALSASFFSNTHAFAQLPLESNPPVGFRCLCAKGWTGAMCDFPSDWCSPGSCFNGGTCVEKSDSDLGYLCHCQMGFTGTRCEWNINDCKDNPCQNKGVCVDEVNAFHCKCPAGFGGLLCQDVEQEGAGDSTTLSAANRWVDGQRQVESPSKSTSSSRTSRNEDGMRNIDDWLLFSKLLLISIGIILVLLVVLLLFLCFEPKRVIKKLMGNSKLVKGRSSLSLSVDSTKSAKFCGMSAAAPPPKSVLIRPPASAVPKVPDFKKVTKEEETFYNMEEERYVAEPSLRPGPEARRRLHSEYDHRRHGPDIGIQGHQKGQESMEEKQNRQNYVLDDERRLESIYEEIGVPEDPPEK